MQLDTRKLKKLIIKAVPYIAFSYVGNLIGFAYRTAEGNGFQEKVLPFMSNLGVAFSRIFPCLHPFDLLFGLVLAGVMRLVLYVKSKNRKKFRQGEEYGSAVWGGAKDIEPYMDCSNPDNNVILTKTESLTMGKPSAPKYARNKNILVIGGSGSGKTRFFVKPNLMQMHSSYVVTDPKGTVLIECGKMLRQGRPKRVNGKIVYRKDINGNYIKDKNGKYINHLLKVFEGDRLELVVNIAAYYGLRRSEIIGLKWDAIDFDKGTLTVCRKITSIFEDGHEQLRIDENLKTEASVRTLPLIPHIEKMLKKRMMLEMQYSQILKSDFDRTFDGFVCRDNTGAIITPEYVTRHFKMIIKKFNLRPLRFHDLRHSCASLLLASGVSMKAIQDWLGHSTFNVTANFYSHLDYQSRVSSAEVIANALGDEAETEENESTNEKTGS